MQRLRSDKVVAVAKWIAPVAVSKVPSIACCERESIESERLQGDEGSDAAGDNVEESLTCSKHPG